MMFFLQASIFLTNLCGIYSFFSLKEEISLVNLKQEVYLKEINNLIEVNKSLTLLNNHLQNTQPVFKNSTTILEEVPKIIVNSPAFNYNYLLIFGSLTLVLILGGFGCYYFQDSGIVKTIRAIDKGVGNVSDAVGSISQIPISKNLKQASDQTLDFVRKTSSEVSQASTDILQNGTEIASNTLSSIPNTVNCGVTIVKQIITNKIPYDRPPEIKTEAFDTFVSNKGHVNTTLPINNSLTIPMETKAPSIEHFNNTHLYGNNVKVIQPDISGPENVFLNENVSSVFVETREIVEKFKNNNVAESFNTAANTLSLNQNPCLADASFPSGITPDVISKEVTNILNNGLDNILTDPTIIETATEYQDLLNQLSDLY